MNTHVSELTSPLSKKPFFIADGVILLVAIFIAWTGPTVLGVPELLGIAACVGLGALLAVVPFVIGYTRREEAAFAIRQAQLIALSAQTNAALEKLHAFSPERPAPTLPTPESPALLEAFDALQARLDTLEATFGHTATNAQADLRQFLEERRAEETRSFAALQETMQHAIVAHQQTSAAQADTLLASVRATAADQPQAIRRALDEAILAARQELTDASDRLASRLDERWQTAFAPLENKLTAAVRQHVAEELAEERAAAARRAIPAATLSLEPTPAAPPSGKSRLGRGLESLIASPQAKPAAAPEPSDATAPASAPEAIAPAPSGAIKSAPSDAPESFPSSPLPAAPAETPAPSLIASVSSQPAVLSPAAAPKRGPVGAALDPFHIPADGYADLAQAMDAGYEESSSHKSR